MKKLNLNPNPPIKINGEEYSRTVLSIWPGKTHIKYTKIT